MSGLRCTVALLWLVLASVSAQTASEIQLDLGMDVAGPGQHVFLPVTLSTHAGSTVTRVVLEATFSEDKLLYEETLPGAATPRHPMRSAGSARRVDPGRLPTPAATSQPPYPVAGTRSPPHFPQSRPPPAVQSLARSALE